MKQVTLVVVGFAFAAMSVACAPKATPEDCQKTCAKLAGFEAGGVKADAAKKFEQAAAQKLAALEKEKADAIATLEKDNAKAKGPKAKVAKELATKKDALVKQFDEKIQAAQKENEAGLKAAQEADAKAAQAQAEKVKSVTDGCIAQCDGKWAKAVVECQDKAASAADFNGCVK